MKCPHCLVEVNPSFAQQFLGKDSEGNWAVYTMICPNENCKRMIVHLANGTAQLNHHNIPQHLIRDSYRITVHPFSSARPIPSEVESHFANDFNEASLILSYSPKASAALSRRCLQNVLREKATVKKGDLSNEIQQVIDSKMLPSYLADSIDAVRNIGNFGAHPIMSTSTGEIFDVEPGEAEWLLDVLESLFDFYFVQPAITKAKRDALNKKLTDAGKPVMK